MSSILSFSGPSGAGKTTIARALLAGSTNMKMVESITTRPPRPSDLSGEYQFLSAREFEVLKERGDFLWHTSYAGSSYATRASSVREVFEKGDTTGLMILTPDVIPTLIGFLDTLGYGSRYLSIFLTVAREETLRERLIARGDAPADIERRLREAASWEQQARAQDVKFHFLSNAGSIEETLSAVRKLLI